MKSVVALLVLILTGCTTIPTKPGSLPEVGIDPTAVWDPLTTNCKGEAITGVTYNAYWKSGNDPFPTVAQGIAADSPCGVYQVIDISSTLVHKVNTSPLTVPTVNMILPDGKYNFASEGVSSSGVRGAFTSVPFNVVNATPAPSNVNIK